MQLKNLLFAALLAVGCGAQDDGYETIDESTDELGEVEQAFNSDNTNGWLQGVRTSSSLPPLQCLTTQPSTTTCFIPDFKFGKTYCVNPTGWASTTERNAVRNVLANVSSGILSQVSAFGIQPGDVGWGHTVRASGTACVAGSDIIFSKATLSPVGGNNMMGYTQLTVGSSTVTLTESLPGTFKKYTGGASCFIDKADIDARGATLTEDTQLLVHAVAQCYANSMGIGTTVNTAGTATDPGVTPFVGTFGTITSGQACRAAHFRHGTTSAYVSGPNVTPACANN